MTIKFNFKNISLLAILFFILLYFRRGQQLIYPEVWDEDGTYNIVSFIKYGWLNLFEPVAGYLITIPKLITNISMSISFLYYPEISTYITWFFTIFVALSVVYSPTHLRYPLFASILIFFIPTDAENFGLPLYTFWFSAILLFLVALWKKNEKQYIKNLFLFICGISSPVIVLLVPIQIYRSIVFKEKNEEFVSLFIAVILSVVQISFILKTGTHSTIPMINFDLIYAIIIKFFAFYYMRDVLSEEMFLFPFGILFLSIIVFYWFYNKKDIYFYILLFLLVSSIGLSVIRVDPNIIDPVLAGPRYFFFPYILLSWLLLYMINYNKIYTIMISFIILFSILLSMKNFGRNHDILEWKRHIVSCQFSTDLYQIPIHFNGDKNLSWSIVLKPEVCKELIKNDLFNIPEESKRGFLTFKNLNYDVKDESFNFCHDCIIKSDYLENAIFDKKSINGFVIYGSNINGDKDIATIKFEAKKDSSLLVMTGPVISNQIMSILNKNGTIISKEILEKSDNWKKYSFSKDLPESFIVEISDNGTGWGEWSAVAFKKGSNEN